MERRASQIKVVRRENVGGEAYVVVAHSASSSALDSPSAEA